MQWIYSMWWKWVCVALLAYVLIGNFFVPLGPGIINTEPSVLRPDSVYTLYISAYHSHFQNPGAGKVQLWFKNGNNYYQPLSLQITGNESAVAKFAVNANQQDSIRPYNFDVVMNDALDGTFALREALTFVKSSSADSAFTARGIIVEPEVKNNKHRLFCFPYREILYETIRNTFFHVPMWFVMTMLVFASLVGSIMYLVTGAEKWDLLAQQSAVVALLFGGCGYLTGLVWAKYTWYIGSSWGDVLEKLLLEDVKMAAALIAIFFYAAYLLLRALLNDMHKLQSIAAIYNVVAFVVFILCVFVMPRLTDSMHPGNGGNPAFSAYDLDNTLRLFFYPAVIGWILLGFWILSIRLRIQMITQKQK